VLPANESLDRGDLVARQVQYRLVVKNEFLARERVCEARSDLLLTARLDVELRGAEGE